MGIISKKTYYINKEYIDWRNILIEFSVVRWKLAKVVRVLRCNYLYCCKLHMTLLYYLLNINKADYPRVHFR